MTEERPDNVSARLLVIFIAAIFLLPLLWAAFAYYGGSFTDDGQGTNNGALLEPIMRLDERLPASPLHKSAPNQWLMVYARRDDCTEECLVALRRLRQSRLMLGNDMNRVARVFLRADSAADTVLPEDLAAGLITTKDGEMLSILEGKIPSDLSNGGFFLVDPLSNLVMYFSPDLEPRAMIDDVEHLLKLSRIG